MPSPPFATRQAQHLPAIAADDLGATVALTEFSEYRWRIGRSRCTRSGCSALERVDQATVTSETIDTDPRIAGDTVVWTDLRVRRPDHDVRLRRGASPETSSLATTDGEGAPQLRPAVALSPGGRALVVWQDARGSASSLRACVVLSDGTTTTDVALLDDDARRYAPEVAWLDEERALVAYETTSTGERRVGVTTLEVASLVP